MCDLFIIEVIYYFEGNILCKILKSIEHKSVKVYHISSGLDRIRFFYIRYFSKFSNIIAGNSFPSQTIII